MVFPKECPFYGAHDHGSCHGKPASTSDLESPCPMQFNLTLLHRMVSKCSPPTSKQALRILKIFLDT
jgi:hypothetical protein